MKAQITTKGRLNLFGDDNFDFDINSSDTDDNFEEAEGPTSAMIKVRDAKKGPPNNNSISMIEEEDKLILMIADDLKFDKYVPRPETLYEEDGIFDGLEERKSNAGSSSISASFKIGMLDDRTS